MRAQTSIEMLVLVAFGLIFLIVLVQLIFSNLDIYYGQQQQQIGTQSLSFLANEIDDVYFMGPGTTKMVTITMPEAMDLGNSSISGKSLVMNIEGTDYIRDTKVTVVGDWPGKAGTYTFKLIAYNDFVAISTDLLDFNPNNIAVSLAQGQNTNFDVNILNLSTSSTNYTFSINFSHSGATLTSSDTGLISFLASDYNNISLTFACARTAVGNFDGNLFFDGADDVSIPVKLYCQAGQSRLSVYPSSKDFNQIENTTGSQKFQVCNSSNTNYSSSSAIISGEISPYVFTSFSGDINANTCRTLSLSVTSPAVGDQNIYLGKLTVNSAGFTATTDLNLYVTAGEGGDTPGDTQNYYFASIVNSDLNHWFDFNGFVWLEPRTNSFWAPTGTLDWGGGKEIDEGYSKWNNLKGLWHLNEGSGTSLADSSGNGQTGTAYQNLDAEDWVGGVYGDYGLNFDAIAYSYMEYMYVPNATGLTTEGTYSFWFKWNGTYLNVFRDYGTSPAAYAMLYKTGDDLSMRFYSENLGVQQDTYPFFDKNKWHNIILTFSTTEAVARTYLDGEEIMELTNFDFDKTSSTIISLASTNPYGVASEQSDCVLDEVAILDTFLNPTEVAELYDYQNKKWVDQNLLAYYKFDSSSGTTVYDSAEENNGTLTSSATLNTRGLWDSNSLLLNGTSSYVNLPAYTPPTNLTISAWIKTSDYTDTTENTIYGWADSENVQYYRAEVYDNKLCWWGRSSTGNYRLWASTNSVINDNFWHHVVIIQTGVTTPKMFVDGTELAVGLLGSSGTFVKPTVTSCAIGRNGAYNGYFFGGKIDELKVFDRVLSTTEIIADYNSFLNAKFVDSNIIDAGASADWNQIKINSDVNYSFGKEICAVGDTYGCNTESWQDGLVGLWHLNNTALDSSDNGNDGSWSGNEAYDSGLWGANAGTFGGSTDYVTLTGTSTLMNGKSKATYSAWIYPNENKTQGVFVSTNTYLNGFFYSAGNIRFYIRASATCSASAPLLPDERWHHVVGTWEAGTPPKIYVDGALKNTSSITCSSTISQSEPILIGYQTTNDGYFNGSIEEVGVWDIVLTEQEIVDLYRKGVSRLDLNVYSCSDVLCTTKTSEQLIEDVNNNSWMTIPVGVSNSQYFGYEVIFGKASGFNDYNAGIFYVGAYLKDVNISYSS